MSYSPELNKRIELYAAGLLEGRELLDFEAQLEMDAGLKKETLFRKSVVDAIREVRQRELKSYIKAQSKVRLAANPWGKVWTIASVVIVVVAAAVYFIDLKNILSKQETTQEEPNPVVAPPVIVQNETKDTVSVVEDTTSVAETESAPVQPYKTENYTAGNQADETEKQEERSEETARTVDTVSTDPENNEEIIVKRDELLATINLKPIVKVVKSAEKQLTEDEISNSTAEKLNPEARLPDPEPKQELFRVELWKSPINFRGYRMVKNRLTLFGVEQNVILRLYRIDDELYLEYGPGQFSKLYPGDQFNAFVRIRDPEILSQLTQ
jgi:hypothetical protein